MTTALQVASGSRLRFLNLWTEGIPLAARNAACQFARVARNFGHEQLMRVCIELQQGHWFDSYQYFQVGHEIGQYSTSILTPVVWINFMLSPASSVTTEERLAHLS